MTLFAHKFKVLKRKVGENDDFSLIRQVLLARLGKEGQVVGKDWLIFLSVG
jgi:hypothetical protein